MFAHFRSTIVVFINILLDGGFKYIAKALGTRIYSNKIAYGFSLDRPERFEILECDKELEIRFCQKSDKIYFNRFLENRRLLDLNVNKCYVALIKNDQPCFIQWLVMPSNNSSFFDLYGDIFPILNEDEAILEGAYIPKTYRGYHIMQTGISKILNLQENSNISKIFSFVDVNNIASIKGVSRCGFKPYILRVIKWRFFKRNVFYKELTASHLLRYSRSVE